MPQQCCLDIVIGLVEFEHAFGLHRAFPLHDGEQL
jgi:hypothetical protein